MRRQAYRVGLGVVVLGGAMLLSATAQAHFVLLGPASMTEQNQLGDPQKTPKCGGGPDATMTGEVTTFAAGETITITIDETIFHPGHYRVALAMSDEAELPDAPPVTPAGGDECASTEIMDPPVFPVLADGELLHDAPFDGTQSFEVTLPDDIECDNCILQVIEFMSNHGAPCYYYHCANIAIEAAPAATTGPSGSTGDADPSTTGDSGPFTTGDPATTGDTANGSSSDSASASGPDTSPDTTTGVAATDTGTATDTDSSAEDSDDSEGCACTTSRDGPGGLAAVFGLMGLLGLRRGRRR